MYKITDTSCPKCGHKVQGATFIHGGDMTSVPHAGELKRTCHQCGYFWYISALDDEENAESPHNN